MQPIPRLDCDDLRGVPGSAELTAYYATKEVAARREKIDEWKTLLINYIAQVAWMLVFWAIRPKTALDCAQRSPRESGKRIRISYPLHGAVEDNQPVSKEQGKGPLIRSEKLSVTNELVQNTRQYFDMIMNYLDSAAQEISSEITTEMKAALQLATKLLQQKYNEETKEVETEPVLVKDTTPKHERKEYISKKCAGQNGNNCD